MNWSQFNISFGLLSAIATLLGIAAAAIWFFIRRRRERLWLPALRVLSFEQEKLPKLRFTPPPWIAFLAFCVCALVVIALTGKPSQQIYTPFRPEQNRSHIYLDMSPSVSAYTDLTQYASEAGALFARLKKSGRVTASTSHSADIFEPANAEEVAALAKQKGFHRSGVKLGESLKKLTPLLGDVDRLFIVSDGDRHSWDDLNWHYLAEEMEIYWNPVAEHDDKINFFINHAQFLSSADTNTIEWDVEIASNKAVAAAVSGTIEVSYRNKLLTSSSFTIPQGRERVNTRLRWSGDEQADALVTASQDPLVWKIKADQNEGLLADNEYRSLVQGVKQDALLIADPLGEMFLDDPAHHLEVSLDLLGFNVKRLDYVSSKDEPSLDAPFWVLLGGAGKGVDSFCPSNFVHQRLSGQSLKKLPLVWLAPYAEQASYREVCHCFSKLAVVKSDEKALPAYCEDIQTRDQWIGVLTSLGAKQVGGEVGDMLGALAYHIKDPTGNAEVLAFTVPLRPQLGTGLRYADMPRIVRALLGWQGLLQEQGALKKESWPRWNDITLAPPETEKNVLVNVPSGESMLQMLEPELLPPAWQADTVAPPPFATSRRDDEDPLPWIRLAIFGVVGAICFEVLARLFIRVRQFWLTGFLLAIFFGATPSADAAIMLNIAGFSGEGLTAHRLTREVESRTSIDLKPMPVVNQKIDAEALREPWLWVKSTASITDGGGQMQKPLLDWVQRGGFLVIEDSDQEAALQHLVASGFPARRAQEGWRPIPPDHELMRSFHLLDSLPSCPGRVWRGYHFDGRLAILAIPQGFLESILDRQKPIACFASQDYERNTRVFVNLLMVALATDYKKDQIHLPEILKRLR